jgi:hypothetical protein
MGFCQLFYVIDPLICLFLYTTKKRSTHAGAPFFCRIELKEMFILALEPML